MVNANYNTTDDIIKKLQSLKGKRKVNFYTKKSKFFDERKNRRQSGTFQFEEDTFSKNTQNIGKNYKEVLLLIKFLQTKPQIKDMNIKYYELYNTVIKNRDEKKVVNIIYEDNEIDYINFVDFLLLIITLEEKMVI